MAVDLVVPEVGESITEVEIGQWLVAEGDFVEKDQPIVEIETDKVTLELPAPVAGVISSITHAQGTECSVGDVIGAMQEGSAPPEASAETSAPAPAETPEPAAAAEEPMIMPAAQRMLDEHGLQAASISATGPGGRLLKEDVQKHLEQSNGKAVATPPPTSAPAPAPTAAPTPPPAPKPAPAKPAKPLPTAEPDARGEKAVPMTPLRRRIAERLVEAQQTAALLTTFNECDMSEVMALRSRHKEGFEKKHGVKLGFMSFFVKAVVDALYEFPQVGGEIRGRDVILKDFIDIGIAVGTGKGLVVPVLRDADRKSFAEIEQSIGDFGKRAQAGQLGIEELQGGTFTITNGGVFGSMLSTPIVNPPQSAVLGMHNIVRRPIAVGTPGKDERIEIRPMMYLALTYDHRLIDGREAVTFLKRIKDTIEEPARMLMEV